jgi:hypothetical protein
VTLLQLATHDWHLLLQDAISTASRHLQLRCGEGVIEMGRSRSAGKRLTCMTRLAILLIEGMRVKP